MKEIGPFAMNRLNARSPRFSRRTLMGAGLGGAAMVPLGPVGRASATPVRATGEPVARMQETATSPASWRTWLLTSAHELRPAAPGAPAQQDIEEVVGLQAAPTDAATAAVARWGGRPAVLVWTELANAAYEELGLSPIREYRANALLQTAMYDAVVAAYDAQDAYDSPAPATVDARIKPIDGIAAGRPSFPSEHAAVAGAAAAFLTALLPDAKAGRFDDLADEAATSRLQAGLNLRRDTDAGLALGRAIGARAIAIAEDDAPASAWDGSGRPTGDGYWEPTPPAFVEQPQEPLAPTWHRWVLTSADQYRPAPPPAFASQGWNSQLAAVREAVARRTFAQARAANFWQNSPATMTWDGFAADLIVRWGLDLPRAARVLALTGVAIADAEIAAWDAKYAYWTARPITADPDLDVLFPTPPFPSFPSAHSTVSNAAAVVLAHLFPQDADDLFALAAEAAASRAWAGIHFPIDNDAGQALGRNVGYLVTALARIDGAEDAGAA
jgi:membrane-associated phospholipid phosphatase